MFLVRKISQAKWQSLVGGGLSADAITVDLRTQQNRLSLWRVNSDSTVADAILAMAAEGDRITKMDVAWVPEQDVVDAGLTLEDSPGKTPVRDLVKSHVHLQDLNYARLGQFADHVHSRFVLGHHKRFTKSEVTELLAHAVDEERLALDKLEPPVREAVERIRSTH